MLLALVNKRRFDKEPSLLASHLFMHDGLHNSLSRNDLPQINREAKNWFRYKMYIYLSVPTCRFKGEQFFKFTEFYIYLLVRLLYDASVLL